MRPLILVFARNPAPGRVKTRLGLAPERAAALHEAFVRDTLNTVAALSGVDAGLSCDEASCAWPEWTGLRLVQCAGGGLGERMYDAISRGLSESRDKVMIVGSDSPELPPSHLIHLLQASADIALGPTGDGGYYAVASARAEPGMFAGVRWSSDSALSDTVYAARACGLTVEIGPEWFDVDTPADLERLRSFPRWRSFLEGAPK